jgi:hypothetical protein
MTMAIQSNAGTSVPIPEMSDMLQLVGHDADSSLEERVKPTS